MHIVAQRLQKECFLTCSGVDDPGVERPLFWPQSHPSALFSTPHYTDICRMGLHSCGGAGHQPGQRSDLALAWEESLYRNLPTYPKPNQWELLRNTPNGNCMKKTALLPWNSMSYFIRTLEKVSANAAAINWHVRVVECLVGSHAKLGHPAKLVFWVG